VFLTDKTNLIDYVTAIFLSMWLPTVVPQLTMRDSGGMWLNDMFKLRKSSAVSFS